VKLLNLPRLGFREPSREVLWVKAYLIDHFKIEAVKLVEKPNYTALFATYLFE
jgi:hypothetical protein